MPPKKRPKRGATAAKKAAPKKATPKKAAKSKATRGDDLEEDGDDGDDDLREAIKRSLSETNREENDLQAALRCDQYTVY